MAGFSTLSLVKKKTKQQKSDQNQTPPHKRMPLMQPREVISLVNLGQLQIIQGRMGNESSETKLFGIH